MRKVENISEFDKMEKVFDEARKAYPGTKRGLATEFRYFIFRCGYPSDGLPKIDWWKAVPLLKPAIEAQIRCRKKKGTSTAFIPPWKNFKTWINNRCWEETEGIEPEAEHLREKELVGHREIEQRQEYGGYLGSKTVEELGKMRSWTTMINLVWLIDEIIAEKRKG